MMIRSGLSVFALVVFLLSLFGCGSKPGIEDEVAVLETSYGRIVIEFAPNVAPKHVQNFKELTREAFYNGTRFHRIVKDKEKLIAIQGGDPNTITGAPSTWGQGQPGQKTVPAEFSALPHVRGTISAARRPNDPNSATSQFFICVAAHPAFDRQYSIFGRVIEGMNVVDSIARAPIARSGETPIDPVVVNRVYVISRDEVK